MGGRRAAPHQQQQQQARRLVPHIHTQVHPSISDTPPLSHIHARMHLVCAGRSLARCFAGRLLSLPLTRCLLLLLLLLPPPLLLLEQA